MEMKKVLYVFLFMGVCGGTVLASDGFGGAATGGQGGAIVLVTTPADLEYYAEIPETPYIILIDGILSIGSSLEICSNKTLRGLNSSATLIGQVGFRNRSSNIVIERLNITNPNGEGEGDGISLKQEISDVLITHCTVYDCEDGCLDITNQSDLVTVSWCKFYYTSDTGHNFANLIGSSDKQTKDRGKLRVTMHHNWWSSLCKERMPRVRYGQVHVYNNYYDAELLAGGYCIGVGVESHLRVENNYFEQVWMPWKNYYADTGYPDGEIGWNEGNIFDNCSEPTWAVNHYDTIFVPPYEYALDKGELVPAIVRWGAGADGKEGYPPHWMLTLYGDFNSDGIVDWDDLASMADFWLENENIDNADFNGDGVVDMHEWALFAGNWLCGLSDTTAPATPAALWALGDNGQAVLKWAANSEEDLAGYYVYRSQVSGADYVPLNEPPLSGTEYIDTDVANGMMYYYTVSAVDTSRNESRFSVQACAVPSDVGPSILLQEEAMGFCGIEGIIDYGKHNGFTGVGFLDTENANGAGINWKINIASAGDYSFTWRFANGSTDRSARLLINGTESISSINFPATGAWNAWSEVSVAVPMTAGLKTIRLEATNNDGCANIDYLHVSGPAPKIAGCE